ncbi:SRPBCC family protein [Belliella sp. R4-6]|uniref:SRPBCC family protein n=1 Tax=Belliella alkalica TaxID=1730871 RepID=A0ABS9VGT9_9BACT|nr:SRPBCC family protein [Belliella alkalica]MCH7415374.1 SRPBCC family protein [Belliella alkalica]
MKILKTIGIILFLIIAIPLIAALFTKKDVHVSREITIEQPKKVVFDYMKYLKNQHNYSKWDSIDPNMERNYSGTDGEVGFIYSWKSDDPQVGIGEQEILAIDDANRIEYALRFTEPFKGESLVYLEFEALSSNKTKVIWGFDETYDYPKNILLWFFDLDKMIGDDFGIGLNNLKEIMEK